MTTKMLRNTIVILMMAVLPALTGAWQAQAINYPSYRNGNQRQEAMFDGAQAPSSDFRSTSSFTGQISTSRQESMLNSDGSINGGVYMPGSAPAVRKGSPGSSPGTPGGDLDPHAQQPIGDAVLPLLMLALAYVGMRTRRRAPQTYNK